MLYFPSQTPPSPRSLHPLHLSTAVVSIYNVEYILLISLDAASKLTLEKRLILLIHKHLAPFSLLFLLTTYPLKTEQPHETHKHSRRVPRRLVCISSCLVHLLPSWVPAALRAAPPPSQLLIPRGPQFLSLSSLPPPSSCPYTNWETGEGHISSLTPPNKEVHYCPPPSSRKTKHFQIPGSGNGNSEPSSF